MTTLVDTYGERFDLLLGPGDRHALANVGVSHSAKLMVDRTTQALEEIKLGISKAGHRCSVLLGAQGPVMIKASLNADGILLNYSDLEMVEWGIEQIKSDISDTFQLGVFPPTFIGDCQDIESNIGISLSAAMVAIGMSKAVRKRFGLGERIDAARELLKNRGQIDAEIVKSLNKETLQRFAFCGTIDQLVEYMKALEELGVTSTVFGPPQGTRKSGVDDLVIAKSAFDMT